MNSTHPPLDTFSFGDLVAVRSWARQLRISAAQSRAAIVVGCRATAVRQHMGKQQPHRAGRPLA